MRKDALALIVSIFLVSIFVAIVYGQGCIVSYRCSYYGCPSSMQVGDWCCYGNPQCLTIDHGACTYENNVSCKDYCSDSYTLVDKSCTSSGCVTSGTIDCRTKETYESDACKGYTTGGYIKDYYGCSGGECTPTIHKDTCINSTHLREYCASGSSYTSVSYTHLTLPTN